LHLHSTLFSLFLDNKNQIQKSGKLEGLKSTSSR